jgi:hypothetical protein
MKDVHQRPVPPVCREASPPVGVSARWIREPANDFGRLAITSDTMSGPVVTEYDVQLNGDGRDDVLTMPLDSAHLKAFSGLDLALLDSYFASQGTGGVYLG